MTSIPCYGAGYPIALTLGQLIVNGELYQEVSYLSPSVYLHEKTWKYNRNDQSIYVHFPEGEEPLGKLVEITSREKCFAPLTPGIGHIVVRGFIMQHAGNQYPADFWVMGGNHLAGALCTANGHNWLIEHNLIRENKSIGLNLGGQGRSSVGGIYGPIARDQVGYHVARFNVVECNGTGGIKAMGCTDVVIEHNVVRNNNTLLKLGWNTGAIKTAHFDGTIRNNWVVDNHCDGIWLDNDYTGARVTGNFVHNNAQRGIFLEMGSGPALVDNNVVSGTRKMFTAAGYGIYGHDAAGVTLVHNLIAENEGPGLFFRTLTERRLPSSNWLVTGNIFWGNGNAELIIPFDGVYAQNNHSDRNLLPANAGLVASGWGGDITSWNGLSVTFANQLDRIKAHTGREYVGYWSGFTSRTVEFYLQWTREAIVGPSVEGVDRDLMDGAIGTQSVIGPFQDVQPGTNRFLLELANTAGVTVGP